MKSAYRILITNDDGYNAIGLIPLINRLALLGKIYVVVPDQSRSSVSHCITLTSPVRAFRDQNQIRKYPKSVVDFYIVNGTPADCVRLGLLKLCLPKVDLVVSGINQGANLGDDVIYSGTVAAAREATLLNVPSLAVSLDWEGEGNYSTAASYTVTVSKWVLNHKLPHDLFLNLNVPDLPLSQVKGLTVTRLGKRIYDERIEVRKDPRGLSYYWLGGKYVTSRNHSGTDFAAINAHRCSLTPLKLDHTATEFIPELINKLNQK